MSEVCRDFGVSRKTGYKIFNRYKDEGLEALTDRSRCPVRHANQLPDPVEAMIVRLKKEKPHWGARKIRELLVRKLVGDLRIQAKSTVHAVLDRHGLVAQARRRTRHKAEGTALSEALQANDLWCADVKGEFKLGNGRYCYPLTVTDQAPRPLADGAPVTLGIRPEHVVIGSGEGLAARVELIEPTGFGVILHASVNGQALKAFTLDRSALALGGTIAFRFPPEHIHLFDETGKRLD